MGATSDNRSRTRSRRRLTAIGWFALGAALAAVVSWWHPQAALAPALVLDLVVVVLVRRELGGATAAAVHGDNDARAAITAAREVAREYIRAFNADDLAATRAVFHYPSIRFIDGDVRMFQEPSNVGIARGSLADTEGLAHTRLDELVTVQADSRKVHLAARFTRLDSSGHGYATYDALWIVTNANGRWAIQARSTFAPSPASARYT